MVLGLLVFASFLVTSLFYALKINSNLVILVLVLCYFLPNENLRLYPSIKNLGSNELLAANGTSCRHQIYDGTKIKSLHPISILKSALK